MAFNPPAHGLHPEDDDDSCLDLENDDEKIYKKAVKMHGPGCWLNQPMMSLKDLCIEFYIERAKEWLSIKDKTSINIFDSIPNFLRAQFLDYIAEYVQLTDDPRLYDRRINLAPHLFFQLICLLILKDTRKMKLGSLLESLEDKEKTEITGGVGDILSQLSAESPNLKQLSFTVVYNSCSNYIFDRHQLLDQLLACKFQNLALLRLGIINDIGNKQLQDISLNFPLLVFLSVGLATSIKPNALVASLSNLKRLRVFGYMIGDGSMIIGKYHELEKLKDEIFNLCAANLPHLEYLRYFLLNPETEPGRSCYPKCTTVIFSGSSQLRQLCTSGGLPEASLPNLNYLSFKGPILNIEEFDARVSLYKHLTSLLLSNVEEKRVCRLLELVGHQLTNLDLNNSPIRFSDLKIVALCPKLVKLHNFGCYRYSIKSCIDYEDERNVSRMLCFLKDLSLNFNGTRAPQPLLKMLLASPKLEELSIDYILMSAEVCRFFSQLKCRSLKRFYFDDIMPAMDCSIRDLEMMVRGLFIHLPSLTSMLIALHHDYTIIDNGGLFSDWDANVKKYLKLLWSDMPDCEDSGSSSENEVP